jgi:hypothetical protein
MIPVRVHSNCSEWVEERYRVCADVGGAWAREEGADGATDGWNFFYLKGEWFRQRFAADHAPGLVEGALFHFQVWKRAYKKQQGAVQLPRAGEGGAIVFTREGFRLAQDVARAAGGVQGWGEEGGGGGAGWGTEGLRGRKEKMDGEALAAIHSALDDKW